MKNKTSKSYKILAIVLSMLVSGVVGYLMVRAGSLTPPAGSPSSTMYTLDDIYHRLDKNAGEPASYGLDSPGAPGSTMHTLEDIWGITPNFRGDPGTATAGDVCNSATFYSDSSTKLTGTRTDCSAGGGGGGFPDTGQTTSYTATFGEDHDYTSANSAATCDPSFTNNGDGTVTDHCTGLMWQQATGSTMNWETAIATCEAATTGGEDDWRLPNIKELQSIVNYKTYNPAVFSEFAADSGYYWSSTTNAALTPNAWSVGFNDGSVLGVGKTFSGYVRCVRQ